MLVRRVAADPGVLVCRGARRRRPSPGARRPSSVGAVADDDLDDLRRSVAEPAWSSTTTALRVRADREHDVAALGAVGVRAGARSTRTGSSTSVSAGTSTSSVSATSARPGRETAVVRARSPEAPQPRASSPSTVSTRDARRARRRSTVGAGAVERRRRRAGPRSRLSGVNRQISSRPVGTGWSVDVEGPLRVQVGLATFVAVSTAVRPRARGAVLSHSHGSSLSSSVGGAGASGERRA